MVQLSFRGSGMAFGARLLGLALGIGTQMWPGFAASGPFDALIGSWGGSGTYRLDDGRTEKVRCDAYYTGGGTQLGMVVRCTSETNKLEIRSKLSASGNVLSGSWEERTYHAQGTVAGQIMGEQLSLNISGGITGKMNVSFGRSRQNVAISTQGIPLQNVTIGLTRK
jgi:hypothetical protein